MIDEKVQYIVNPDVSCREEGPAGALLFNPDSDQVLVVNSTGRLIWQALDEPLTLDELTSMIHDLCIDVPEDVQQDVLEYVERLVSQGFIGVYGGLVGG